MQAHIGFIQWSHPAVFTFGLILFIPFGGRCVGSFAFVENTLCRLLSNGTCLARWTLDAIAGISLALAGDTALSHKAFDAITGVHLYAFTIHTLTRRTGILSASIRDTFSIDTEFVQGATDQGATWDTLSVSTKRVFRAFNARTGVVFASILSAPLTVWTSAELTIVRTTFPLDTYFHVGTLNILTEVLALAIDTALVLWTLDAHAGIHTDASHTSFSG